MPLGVIRPSEPNSSRPHATFRGSLGCLCLGMGSRRLLGARSRGSPRPRHLADSRIPGDNDLAGAQRSFLKIWRIGRKNLPAGYLLPECLNGSHIRKFASETFVVLLGGGEPHTVVCRVVALEAEDEDNLVLLVLNIDREGAKHGA